MSNDELLSQIRNVLLNVQTRLSKLEVQSEEQMILDETNVVERRGLGGRTVLGSSKGGIKKNIRLPFCYVSSRNLGDNITICEECGNPCSPEYTVNFDGISRCLKCLQQKFPKRTFKVLCCTLLSKKQIHKITRIPKHEIKPTLLELEKHGLIVKKGIIFRHFELTDVGKEFLYLYSRVYREEDVIEIHEKIREHTAQQT